MTLIENTGYSFSIEKLESRNTVKLNDKRYLDITSKAFQTELSGDLTFTWRFVTSFCLQRCSGYSI